MMMTCNVIDFIKNFLSAFICCFGSFLIGTIIYRKSIKELKLWHYLLMIFATLFIIANSLIVDNVAKIFGTLFIFFILFKLIYKISTIDAISITIFTYIILGFGELTFTVIFSLIDIIFSLNIMDNIIRSITGNLFIAIFSCFFAFRIRKQINEYLVKINKSNAYYIIIIGIVTVFVVISSIFNLSINNWMLDYSFVLNIIIVAGCVTLTIVLFKQYLKNKEILDKYNLLEEYLKTSAELVEKHSLTVHKYKNNLIAVKGYLKSDSKEAYNYVNNLLKDYKNKKYSWFTKINKVNLEPIRYLIYYKLSKAEEMNFNISIDISDDVEKFNYSKLSRSQVNILLEIMGEYFDNALYACEESKEKELSLILYVIDDTITIIITNTFKNEPDINSITKNGYSTKGKNHGLGLYGVDKIIKNNNYINAKYEIIDNNFVVNLEVKN